jgi:uncharacterized protein
MIKFVLGTVQLGLNYGVNNKLGKPSRKESFEILEYAYSKGIYCFDTAAAYGNAEEIIGEFIKTHGLSEKNLKIISKLTPNLLNNSQHTASNIIVDEIEKSLNRLNIKSLDGFLLHTPSNVYSPCIIEGLETAKGKNLSKNIGVSVYEVEDALYAAELKNIDYIQIAYNVLDQRLDKTDFFKIAVKNTKTIFSRSPFLQGLLLMEEKNVPDYLDRSKKYLSKFIKIINKYNYSKVRASLIFSILKNQDNNIVFGVDSLSQLKENISIAENYELNNNFVKDIEDIFKDVDKGIIIPSLWAK